jgi:prolyl oligopeptidase
VLDIDALNETESETWVWKGSTVLDLGPDEPHDIALLKLSRGGADATVIREFNLVSKTFVAEADGGFVLPEAKSSVSWKTRDVLLVGTDTGEGSLTDSGYPREAREWCRGTPLSAAECVFAGEAADVSVRAYCYFDKGNTYNLLSRAMTFYTSKDFLWHDGCVLPYRTRPVPRL